MPYSHQQEDEAGTHFTLKQILPHATPRGGRTCSRSKATDRRMRQTRTDVRHGERVTAKCEDAWPLALAMVGGWYDSPCLLCHLSPRSVLMRQMGNYLQDSPEKSSRLSIHPDLHVLEPGQTRGKCVLTVGRTGLSPFRVLDQQDLQAKRNTGPLQHWLLQPNPSLNCHRVGNPRPGWGGRSPVDRAAPRLAPERTGA